MCSGLEDENLYNPYPIDSMDPPISVLKVVRLEVIVSNHSVVSPVSVCAAACPELIGSVGNKVDVWPPLPLMSQQPKILYIVGEL